MALPTASDPRPVCCSASTPAAPPRPRTMSVDEGLRLVAGTFVLLSLALGVWIHPAFLFFTAFVGLNLLQSAFTRWCPMMAVLRRLGFPG